jgi:hypothetical protein
MNANKTRFLTKVMIDSVNFHVITNNNGSTQPSFKNIEEVKYGYRGNEVMVLPITNHSHDIIMIVECRIVLDNAQSHNKAQKSRMDHSSESNSDDNTHIDEGSSFQGTGKGINVIKGGFNVLDDFTFKILLEFVMKRIEIITSKKDAIAKGKTGKNLINLLGEIIKQKTLIQ